MSDSLPTGPHCIAPSFHWLITKPTTCPSFRDWRHTQPAGSYWILFGGFLFTAYILRLCMGHSASNIYKKTSNYLRGTSNPQLAYTATNSVVVRERRSSLHRDEDDDIAHEFYEEIKQGSGRSKMKKILKTYPLGYVKMPVPCLHPDFTRILLPNYDIMSKLRVEKDET